MNRGLTPRTDRPWTIVVFFLVGLGSCVTPTLMQERSHLVLRGEADGPERRLHIVRVEPKTCATQALSFPLEGTNLELRRLAPTPDGAALEVAVLRAEHLSFVGSLYASLFRRRAQSSRVGIEGLCYDEQSGRFERAPFPAPVTASHDASDRWSFLDCESVRKGVAGSWIAWLPSGALLQVDNDFSPQAPRPMSAWTSWLLGEDSFLMGFELFAAGAVAAVFVRWRARTAFVVGSAVSLALLMMFLATHLLVF